MANPQETIVEASTIGLVPGNWPVFLEYQGLRWHFSYSNKSHGELVSCVYFSRQGGEGVQYLVVLND